MATFSAMAPVAAVLTTDSVPQKTGLAISYLQVTVSAVISLEDEYL